MLSMVRCENGKEEFKSEQFVLTPNCHFQCEGNVCFQYTEPFFTIYFVNYSRRQIEIIVAVRFRGLVSHRLIRTKYFSQIRHYPYMRVFTRKISLF